MQAIQEDSNRLQTGYAGDKKGEIQDREAEVVNAWKNLNLMVNSRRIKLADAHDLFKFFNMVRDLILWMDDIIRQMKTQEKPRYVWSTSCVTDCQLSWCIVIKFSEFAFISWILLSVWLVIYLLYRDVSGVDLLINNHQSMKAEIDAREENFAICINLGKALLERNHYRSDEVSI